MNKYELVYIVDAHLTQAVKDEIAKQVADAIVKSESKLISAQVWLERHKMSFPINKIWEATYYMVIVEAKPAAINKLNTVLKLNEQLLRYLTVRHEAKTAVAATAAVVA